MSSTNPFNGSLRRAVIGSGHPQEGSHWLIGTPAGRRLGAHQVEHFEAVQELAVAVLEAVSLVDDHAAPGDLPQLGAVRQYHLKRGDERVKLIRTGDQVTLRPAEQPVTSPVSVCVE